MKTIIERGASWTLEETKLLLALWGQDLVARQATCLKRTKEVYEKIAERFQKEGYERTPDQVRTRVFNMIAEYRRILKDGNPERMKKCIFFEALHKIYQAKHLSDVKSAVDDYELVNPYSPGSNSKMSELEDASSDGLPHGADDSMDASNSTSNSVSNNNNNSKSTATNNDANKTSTTTNNITSGGGGNNKPSATSDNVGSSINHDNGSAKKTPAGKEGQTTAKRLKTESPRPGTSQGGDGYQDDLTGNFSGDGKLNVKIGTGNHLGGLAAASSASSSSAGNLNASITFSNSASSSNASKQQSLLATATSSPSTTNTPMNKFNSQQQGGNSASFININSTKLPIIRSQILGHSNGNESININGTPTQTARLPTTAAITSHQLYQAPVNTFDVTSSALLIDRMFAHLSKESENMREWIALEKERIALERARRSQETEREIRRERVLIETLMKFQEQWMAFVTRIDPRLIDGAAGPIPELNIPKEILEPLNDSKGAQDGISKVSPTVQSSASKVGASTSGPAGSSTSSVATATTGTTTAATATATATTTASPSTPAPSVQVTRTY